MYPAGALSRPIPAPREAIARRQREVCEIRLVTDRTGFDALESDWTALFDRAGRPDQTFQSFNWLWHWTNHFLDRSSKLSIITGWSGDRLVMAWPLVEKRMPGFSALTFMGGPASQYGDVLVEPGSAAPALLWQGCRTLCASGADVAVLRKIRRSSALASVLGPIGRVTSASQAPYLDLSGAASFDEIDMRFSAKERSSRRRLMRRLEEQGRTACLDAPTEEHARSLVRAAFALKRQSLEAQGRHSPALHDPVNEAFFIDAMSSRERPVGAMINALTCDGRAIGVALSLACKGWGFGHVLAHDVAFDKQGAGIILAEQVFRTAHRRGLSGFDMLAPADAFKLKWASGAVAVEDWSIPLSLKGTVVAEVWLARVRPHVKRLSGRLPPRLGSALFRAYRGMTRARRTPEQSHADGPCQ